MNINNITFERQLKHSYMVIACPALDPGRYETKMILKSRIPGTLRCTLREDTDPAFIYDITSLQSLGQIFSDRPVSGSDLDLLLTGIDQLLERLEEFMLPESMVYLDAESIFMDADTRALCFTCVPGYEADFSESLTRLLAYMLKRIDYTDDASVILAYTLFQESSKPNYGIGDLLRIVRRRREQQKSKAVETGSAAEQATPAFRQRIKTETDPSPASGSCPSESPPVSSVTADDTSTRDMPHVPEQPFVSNSFFSFDADEEDDGLIHNADDDLQHSALYSRTPDLSDGWEDEAHANQRNKKQKRYLKNIAADQHALRAKGKLLLAALIMAAIPFCIWYFKGAELFMRMLPVIIIIELAVAIITALDYFAAPEEDEQPTG